MWTAVANVLDPNVQKISLFQDEIQLGYEDVILHWRQNSEFRTFYVSVLEQCLFDAFFWEHPPVTTQSIRQPYEFVLVNSAQLSAMNADPNPFQEKFSSAASGQTVIAFENLGRDAELIVPLPVATGQKIYAHFASFLRGAPEHQKHELLIVLSHALQKRIDDRPTWVSTSGLGVYWLHIRLDTRPKYYSFHGYRQSN